MFARPRTWGTILGGTMFCLLLMSAIAFTMPGAIVGRTIVFSGYSWRVKSGYGGPGDNYWSGSSDSVWVDSNGYMHLTIKYSDGVWYCSEVYLEQSLGYGQYVFHVASRIDLLNPIVVNGLFLYQGDDHEVDIEFSKWGDPSNLFNTQYAIPPGNLPNHLHHFQLSLANSRSTHIIKWIPTALRFQSIRGFYNSPSREKALIEDWAYPGNTSEVLSPGSERLHINLWLDGSCPAGQTCEAEVVIASFHFMSV